jgi:hypothetical protein
MLALCLNPRLPAEPWRRLQGAKAIKVRSDKEYQLPSYTENT